MAKDRTFHICGINVVTHPHSPDNYVALFKAAFSKRLAVPLRTTQHLMLGEIRAFRREAPMTDGIFGRLYRFDQIDPDGDWYNVARHDVASADELSAISIPDELKPNLVMFDFIFLPKSHKFFYVSKFGKHVLSTGSLLKLFKTLFALDSIESKFGSVLITVLPEKAQLEKLLSLHHISKLEIDLTRPNPDDTSDEEDEVFRRLKEQGARRITQTLTAERHETIQPDGDTALLARVASSNGSVRVVGYTKMGTHTTLSTVDKPWRETMTYDPDVETQESALMAFGSRLTHGTT